MGMIRKNRILSGVTALLMLLTLAIWIGQNWLRPDTPDPFLTTTASTSHYTVEMEEQYTLPNRHKTIDESGETAFSPSLSPVPAEPTAALPSATPIPTATPLPTATPVPIETDANGIYQENSPIEAFTVDNRAIYIKAFNANIRVLPRTDATIIVKATMGDKLTRTGYGNYWSQVKTALGETGYVLTSLISTTIIYKPVPTSTPKPSATPKPSYVIAFITPDAYERNVAAGGSFSKMEVYKIAYNAVWCYYARDAS